MILGIPWLACHNPEIDWRTGEVKMMRCLEECGKQWRPVQESQVGKSRRKRKQRKKQEKARGEG